MKQARPDANDKKPVRGGDDNVPYVLGVLSWTTAAPSIAIRGAATLNRPELAAAPSVTDQARLDIGHVIGRKRTPPGTIEKRKPRPATTASSAAVGPLKRRRDGARRALAAEERSARGVTRRSLIEDQARDKEDTSVSPNLRLSPT